MAGYKEGDHGVCVSGEVSCRVSDVTGTVEDPC